MKTKEELYFAQINYEYQTENFKAKNIFDAAKIAIDKYQKYKENSFREEAGTDISFRIWRTYGDDK